MGPRIVAVDIGTVRPPANFAWAAFDAPSPDLADAGFDPLTAVSALVAALGDARRAVLLLEAPMSVPVPATAEDGWRLLGRRREGEGNRPWSAGAGTGALATGLAQGAWMLGRLARLAKGLTATTDVRLWREDGARLLLAEAFVSALGKPEPTSAGQHAADAAAAGLAMLRLLEEDSAVSEVCCAPCGPFNLLAAMALWAGLAIDPAELRSEVLVVRTVR
ncbi:hypothetical protein [Nonomuraea dietziae]|uniref:hypothetical protein n=1 Tax=Nonomuraea dietziae TaxID=65515 RepID=UPI0033E6AD14